MKETQIAKIVQAMHENIEERSKSFSRLSGNIVLENMVLRLLAEDSSRSPGACFDILRDRYNVDYRIEKVIGIFRDYHINSGERRELLFERVGKIAGLMEKAVHGDLQSLAEFRGSYEALINDTNVRRAKIYSNLILALLYQRIPQLSVGDDRTMALNFGFVICNSIINDLADTVAEVYGAPQAEAAHEGVQSLNNEVASEADGPMSSQERDRLLKRIGELERGWKRSEALLDNLQKEFDERLEENKQQHLTEFFGSLNSEQYGQILDELFEVRQGMEALRKKGYELPEEIYCVYSIVSGLLQFVRDCDINPMLRPDSVHVVNADDASCWCYEGSPFKDSVETKTVRVISPGWAYGEKNILISRPKVQEEV